MNLVRSSMRRPLTVLVAVIAVVLLALFALRQMARDIFPTLNIPTIYVAQPFGGMDAEQMAQIFQPFFTTKKARRGTGLGLAIAVETVRAHGGQIKVDSNPGKGSRFTIVLPADGGSR